MDIVTISPFRRSCCDGSPTEARGCRCESRVERGGRAGREVRT